MMLKNLKKGEYFTIKPIEAPTEKQVYIKGDYDRASKNYEKDFIIRKHRFYRNTVS